MDYRTPLKNSLFLIANLCVTAVLLVLLFFTIQSVIQVLPDARQAALGNANLKPAPADYFWKLNLYHEPLDKNKIRVFADYYEHYLTISPNAADGLGALGYCYCHLEKTEKAKELLAKSIKLNPDYFWNYYNLAMLYIGQRDYKEAERLLSLSLKLEPKPSLITVYNSDPVYLRLLPNRDQNDFVTLDKHFQQIHERALELVALLHSSSVNKLKNEYFENFKPEYYVF